MDQVRPRFLLLAPALGLLGLLAGGWWWQEGTTADVSRAVGAGVLVSTGRTVHFERQHTADAAPISTGAQAAAGVASGPVLGVKLSPKAAAEFAAVCQVRLLAADLELDLSHREWTRLAAAVTETQAVRLAYEAEIAQVVPIAPGRHRLVIPAYAAAGDELRRRFHADLREQLGEDVAADVLAKLGRQLEGSFAGFGVGTQTLEITDDPQGAPGEVTVERRASYWNSIEGTDRVTIRRDVTMPTAEAGGAESWSALLGLIGKTE